MAKAGKSTKTPKVVSLDATEISNEVSQDMLDKLDQGRIEEALKRLEEAKQKIREKVYAVQFESMDQVNEFHNFMTNDAEWKEKEALGVVEICKILDKLKKEGIKDNILYLNALPLEASHYFISKRSGTGLEEAKKFLSLVKPLEVALEIAKSDAQEIQGFERELAAAQQGIGLA